jgi:cupin fold WbuC family metalloprotein
MSHKKGHIIPAHTHNARSSHINTTTEVLIVESGRLATTLYSKNHEFIDTRVLEGGDIIVIMSGGHSFEVIENCIFFEVKQGPFDPTNDKTLFG